MHTDLTFFTNEPERDLYSRFSKILKSNTQFFDVLVGYFRTSGFFKMYEAMESVEKIRILVGLNVDKYTVKIIDKANAELAYEAPTTKEAKDAFSDSIENEFAQSETTAEIEQGVRTFIEWLKNGKLEMRIYVDAPIHAKVYIMRKDMDKVPDSYGSVITGSSNFSEAGLQNNLEFNVELKDSRDVQFALEKFEELWAKGVPITQDYIEAVEKKTWLRNDIKILRHIMIRRTRSEIMEYYADDLKKQGLTFPKLGTPEPIAYVFDEDTNTVFNETVEVIKNFKYSRYKPLVYLKDTKKYASLLTAQHNMGGFMKSILVKRLESSFFAFKNTLSRFQESYEKFIDMYEAGEVYISKKVDVYDLLDSGDDDKLMELVEAETVMHFKSSEFDEKFIKDLKWDLTKLKYLSDMWKNIQTDPKLDQFKYELQHNKKLIGNKKIIFTESKETAEYLVENLTDLYGSRVIAYTGSSSLVLKSVIEDSFNPKFREKNNDQFDVLITTDVLAEGINLHRANALINYDLPWNPTRIMQRVGRINRVGTEFDQIYVFNFFPTAETNKHLPLKDRIMEKLQAFHDTLGEDFKYLSEEEEVSSQKLFNDLNMDLDADEDSANPELAYLAIIRQVRDNDIALFDKIKKLPKKAKTGRNSTLVSDEATVSFIRKGYLKTFFKTEADETKQISFMDAIEYIKCEPDEEKVSVGKNYFSHYDSNNEAFDYSLVEEEVITNAKYDLRDWAPEHEKMGKGITLSADEVQELYKLLSKIVED